MMCVCCQFSCDGTFRVHGYAVCFDCTMNKSHADIMAVVQERLRINVKTWEVPTTRTS